jgi:hypothetical protein
MLPWQRKKMPTLNELNSKAQKAIDSLISSYERKAQRILKKALDETRAVMSEIYEKYAINGVLTKAQMTQYNRLASLEKRLLEILDPAIRATLADMRRLPPEVYADSFFRHAWAIDESSKIALNWGLLNKDAVIAELRNEFDKIAYERYRAGLKQGLRAALNKGLPLGKSYADMARDIKEHFTRYYYEALRIIRTEGQYAMNAGADATYARAEEEGIGGAYVWSATLDGKTRDTHATMDGRERDKDGYYTLPNGEQARYPADENLSAGERINCRCIERFDIDSIPPEYRRTREDGVIEYQTYAEWAYERGVWI